MNTSEAAKKVKLTLKKREVPMDEETDSDLLIPFGCTLLNLACSDTPYGAIKIGRMCQISGGSHAGKSILAFSSGAECARIPAFDDYDLIRDDAEEADDFDVPKLFGSKFADRLKGPRTEDGESINSETTLEFKDSMIRLLESNNPFLYWLDSLDSLADDDEVEKAVKDMEKRQKNPNADVGGDYGMLKQKRMSQMFRIIKGKLRKSRSALFVICQVRDNIGAMPGQDKDKISGGRAQDFYYSHRIKLKMIQHYKSKVDEELEIGVRVLADVVKNKLTGKRRKVEFDVFYDYGIDDVGSMVDFLIKVGKWTKSGKFVDSKGLFDPMTREQLCKNIRNDGLRRKLQKMTSAAWREREESVSLKDWKPQYE
jgi:hypothetical protein